MNILLFLKKNCFRGMARTKQTARKGSARNGRAKKHHNGITKERLHEMRWMQGRSPQYYPDEPTFSPESPEYSSSHKVADNQPNVTAVASKVCACNNDPTAAMCKYCKGNCCLNCGNDGKPTLSDWICWRCIDHEEKTRRAERDVFTNARLLGYLVEQDGNDLILRIPGGMNDPYKAQLVEKITK